MQFVEWVLGIVAALAVVAVGWIYTVVSSLPVRYVPRPQLDARFRDLEKRMHDDIIAQETRTDKRFDQIEAKLDRIIERLERKVDR